MLVGMGHLAHDSFYQVFAMLWGHDTAWEQLEEDLLRILDQLQKLGAIEAVAE